MSSRGSKLWGENTGIEYCDDTVNPLVGCDFCELYNPKKPNEATYNMPFEPAA